MEKLKKKTSGNRDIFTNICEKIGNNYNKSFSKFVTVTLLAFADRTIESYEKNRYSDAFVVYARDLKLVQIIYIICDEHTYIHTHKI